MEKSNISKKILLVSQRVGESSTNDVIDWIEFHGGEFIRLNGIDFLRHCSIKIANDLGLNEMVSQIPWNDIGVVWFRRWVSGFEFKSLFVNKDDVDDEKAESFNKINQFLLRETNVVRDFLFSKIREQLVLFDRLATSEINKLIVLNKAADIGIKIPDTALTTSKKDLDGFGELLITKPISNGLNLQLDGDVFCAYTTLLNRNLMPEKYSLSLVQHCIDKEFEIRSFLLDGHFYSMAIFSQENKQTQVDFRMYDNVNPNRTVPYILPPSVEDKLLQLANYFEIETASFDLIYTPNDEYVFLEINPGGQFGMVSYPCNYFLEEKIAIKLISICR